MDSVTQSLNQRLVNNNLIIAINVIIKNGAKSQNALTTESDIHAASGQISIKHSCRTSLASIERSSSGVMNPAGKVNIDLQWSTRLDEHWSNIVDTLFERKIRTVLIQYCKT